MKILVVGQGGREHTIVRTLKKSPKVNTVYCAPGNGGIALDAICLPIEETDFEGLAEVAIKHQIDLTFVGPENPLFEGIVDYFQEKGLAIIGPNRLAAQIEGSKAFAKDLMKKYNIPTGDYQVFDTKDEAVAYVLEKGAPIVVKADGLAAGKGVIVAQKVEEAIDAIQQIMAEKVFGEAGNRVVIEEFLQGEELTVLAFVDGTTVLPMEPAQDHKPVFDGDKGPNTGGMGSYSPVPHMKKEWLEDINNRIIKPTVQAMEQEGNPFIGILYAGLMMTSEGPKVIEFNARFGDPETQVVLPRLKTDLVDVLNAMHHHQLDRIRLEWEEQAAVCVIMASKGYPGTYEKGVPIQIDQVPEDVQVFFAGVQEKGGQLVTSGGRVLGITALASDIRAAKDRAYEGIQKIHFEGAHFRTDIADKAIR